MAKYFSVSDVMTFLQCREKWDISSPNRRSLRHKATPRLYLTQGTAFHHGIEAQEKGTDPIAAVEAYLAVERADKVAAYRAVNGVNPWPQEMTKFEDGAELVAALTKQYFEHYGTENPLADQGLEYIATEIPFKIDISEHVGIEEAYFVGTFDGIAKDANDKLWLVENKTYSAKPDLQDLMVHFQTTGYAVAWEMLTGFPLTGALYNGVAKKLIKEPRRVKSGALSADVSQLTTLALYTSAILSDGGSLEDPKYAKIIEKLTDIEREGDTRFFYREKIFYNETQIENWWNEFGLIVNEMDDDPAIYRTVPYNGCGPQGADCWWRDVCFASHTGRDVESIIDQSYEVGSYGTIEAVDGIEPVMVASVDELREALKHDHVS